MKTCSKCREAKNLDSFHKNKSRKDGLSYICKQCVNDKLHRKKYNSSKYRKKYQGEYRDKYDYNSLEYRQKYNKKEYRQRFEEYDSLYKFKCSVRQAIALSIRRRNGIKTDKTEAILGCSFEYFKTHIESQFTEGMSWDNYGLKGWHLDHIIPLASAKTEEDVIQLNHYTNLQPLWAIDNWKKGSRIL
jgi:hypothetical protein